MPHQLSSLIRAALFVRDLEVSTAFYRALGFTSVFYEGELDAASANGVLCTPPESRVCCRILRPEGRPNFGMIGLFEISNPSPPALPAAEGPPRLGEVALVIYARPLAEVVAIAHRHGATWSPEPILFTMPHRQQREVCLRDPDGVLINLVERDPAEQDGAAPALG